MIYVDSCVPMYLVGADHPNKQRVLEVAPRLLSAGEPLGSSAEAFQEIIHRYRALGDARHLQAAYEALEAMLTTTSEVSKADVDAARGLAGHYPRLSARDCLHVAVMKRLRCHKIWTFDRGFDLVTGLQRIE